MSENPRNIVENRPGKPENQCDLSGLGLERPLLFADAIESCTISPNSYVETCEMRFRGPLTRDCLVTIAWEMCDYGWLMSAVRWKLAEGDVEAVSAIFVRRL